MRFQLTYTALAVASLAACTSNTQSLIQGSLLDSAVEGVAYSTSSSGGLGTTDSNGIFECRSDDLVTFTLGATQLGKAACQSTITPLDLAVAGSWTGSDNKVNNILLLLQSLDEDDEPGNGIRIPGAVRTALANTALDVGATATAFQTALGAALPKTVNDSFGKPYSQRTPDSTRLALAKEHFESTLAGQLGQSATTRATAVASAGGDVSVTKYTVTTDKSLYVPYPGTLAAVKNDFPQGFFPAAGSGLAYKGQDSAGNAVFYGITDRGPNGDAPATVTNPTGTASKVFPAPQFTPSIATITIGKGGAVIESLLPIKANGSTRVSGRPLPAGAVGNSREVVLTDGFKYDKTVADYDANGIDPESLVFDAANKVFWTSDEYGPFIAKIDASTGVILKKYEPGTQLPAVLAKRRANRGMEGLAIFGGTLHGFLQSPIDPLDGAGKSIEVVDTADKDEDGKKDDKVRVRDFAAFARWLAFDPASETSRLYAYPLQYPVKGEKWDRNRTGSAKLGDMVALAADKFIVIEQGLDASGKVRNFLMLVEIPANATDISADGHGLEMNSIDGSTLTNTTRAWSAVVPLKKTLLLDLNALGWSAEKAEGLAVVDSTTLALVNDNDFGLRSILTDASGAEVSGSPEDCTLDASTGVLTACPNNATGARVTRGSAGERPMRLWLIKLPRELRSYPVN